MFTHRLNQLFPSKWQAQIVLNKMSPQRIQELDEEKDIIKTDFICPICFEQVDQGLSVCGEEKHVICVECFYKLKEENDKKSYSLKCPVCREIYMGTFQYDLGIELRPSYFDLNIQRSIMIVE